MTRTAAAVEHVERRQPRADARAPERRNSLRGAVLRMCGRWFPPNQDAFMAGEQFTVREVAQAPETMGRYLAELKRTDVDVLDFGCGWGGETLWLADHVRSAVGVDIEPGAIALANRALHTSPRQNCRFVCAPDGRLPFADNSFDAVFSTDTFEHVMDLDRAFGEILRVLRPGGSLLTRFGPLFYSPYGYHLYWACAVPYAHLVFGLPAILDLRNARSGYSTRPATWRDMGLNGRRYREYRRAASRAGFELTRFEPLAVKNLRPLTWLPALRDLFIFGIDGHLQKPRAKA
jgi:SAM-dependent methyltransferase